VENGIEFGGEVVTFQTYESNVLFKLRFLIDKDIFPATWVEVKNYEISRERQSLCDIEVDVSCDNIFGHKPMGDYEKIAPCCILSFDIECYGNVEKEKTKTKIRFPKANIKQCKVTQIANTVTINGEILIKNCFCLNTCEKLEEEKGEVLCFETEEKLLMAWRQFVLTIDPDIITGYNIIVFDLPYLFDRAKYLKLWRFPYLGRIKNSKCFHKVMEKGSKQTGKRASTNITFYGRNIVDVLTFTRRDVKLPSYSLNYVAQHFGLGKKEDVHYSMIPALQDATKRTRKRLVLYCIKDAVLPQKLMDKQTIIERTVEISRVTGVPFDMVIESGQQIRILCKLLKRTRETRDIIPTLKEVSGSSFEGAIVKKPHAGFYKVPIGVLDFASLYPSIMIAHNLCYTTFIPQEKLPLFTPDQYIKTPAGHHFVKKHVFKGYLPELLKDLLDTRFKAKQLLKKATDPIRKAVLHGRQLALKICANSVYGFTGADEGYLPMKEISSSVTAFGREMIEESTEFTEKTFRKGNVLKWKKKDGTVETYVVKFDAVVIYGKILFLSKHPKEIRIQ
jgi:DNA polymerase delta subunit 1